MRAKPTSPRIEIDLEANAEYLYLLEDTPVDHTVSWTSEGINIDLTAAGRIIGIECLSGPIGLVHIARILNSVRWAVEQ